MIIQCDKSLFACILKKGGLQKKEKKKELIKTMFTIAWFYLYHSWPKGVQLILKRPGFEQYTNHFFFFFL